MTQRSTTSASASGESNKSKIPNREKQKRLKIQIGKLERNLRWKNYQTLLLLCHINEWLRFYQIMFASSQFRRYCFLQISDAVSKSISCLTLNHTKDFRSWLSSASSNITPVTTIVAVFCNVCNLLSKFCLHLPQAVLHTKTRL